MNIFKSKRRLSRDNTKMVMVGFTKEQMNIMTSSFQNRSLAMSCLSKYIIDDLLKRFKTLEVSIKDGSYVFKEKDYEESTVIFLNTESFNETLIKRSVVIDNETLNMVEKSCKKSSLYRLLPALTLYAIEKLNREHKVFLQDNNQNFNIYIKTN
ncbi:hypothetical protein LZ898_004629 [Salmonella enterica]|nr:hypothetical protein [Salmonella enterica]